MMQNFLLIFFADGTSQKKSVTFLFSSINQAKTHKYEFKHFIYEDKQGFDDINPN